MRITHPPRLPALLLGAALAALPAAAQDAPITVDASHLHSLQGRLDGLVGGLRADERALWTRLLLRAAHAPAEGPEVRVLPVLHIGPGGGCDAGMDDGPNRNRVAIIIQGGRTADGGVAPSPASGIIVQGGRTAGRTPVGGRPAAGVVRPPDAVSIGPKPEDPTRPAPECLAARLTQLSAQLPAEERGALEWLLTRAAAVPESQPVTATAQGRPATPGGRPAGAAGVARPLGQPGPDGLPEGTAVSLRQALGVDALSIGPKREDPTRGAPTPPATRWTLRH